MLSSRRNPPAVPASDAFPGALANNAGWYEHLKGSCAGDVLDTGNHPNFRQRSTGLRRQSHVWASELRCRKSCEQQSGASRYVTCGPEEATWPVSILRTLEIGIVPPPGSQVFRLLEAWALLARFAFLIALAALIKTKFLRLQGAYVNFF